MIFSLYFQIFLLLLISQITISFIHATMPVTNSLPKDDGRRIAGPEKSLPYRVYQLINKPEQRSERSEGRKSDAHRKIFLSTGVISKAKGSAYIEQGGTKIIVGVFGPKEVQKRSDFSVTGTLSTEFKFAPFASDKRKNSAQCDKEAEELSLVVSEALSSTVCLNKYPKSVIEVGITVLQDSVAMNIYSFNFFCVVKN